MKGANPKIFGNGFIDLRSKLRLFRRREGIQGFFVGSLSLLICEEPLDPLFHFLRSLIREGNSEDIFRIDVVGEDEAGNAEG